MIANPTLRNPNSLIVGSRIKIPGGQSSSSLIQLSSPEPEVPVAVQVARASPALSTSSPKTGSSLSHGSESFPLNKAFVLLGQVLSKKHREYKVVEGDSLEWLAEKFGTSVKSIKRLNNLRDDIICTGRYALLQDAVESRDTKS